MYKDKEKQREANRAIQAKRRAKGVTSIHCNLRSDLNPVPERTAQGNIRVSKPGNEGVSLSSSPSAETKTSDRPVWSGTGVA